MSTLTYKCPPGNKVTVTIGTGSSGSFSARTLRIGPAETLEYNVYIDAARTTIWGDGTAPSVIGPGLTTRSQGGDLTAIVYGRIPAGQDVSVGVYADVLQITFEF